MGNLIISYVRHFFLLSTCTNILIYSYKDTMNVQSNLVILNSTGPWQTLRYYRIWDREVTVTVVGTLSHFVIIMIFEIMMFEITNFNFSLRQYKQIAKLLYPVYKITSVYRLICFICTVNNKYWLRRRLHFF